jgi:uncharacterized damage-inducible protein DinB
MKDFEHLAIDDGRGTLASVPLRIKPLGDHSTGIVRQVMEIRTIQPFLHYFGTVRERTMRVARSIPPDKIEWTYAPGKFTLGDILRHLAVAERYMWAENVQCQPSRYTTHGKELAEGYENVMAFMERLHAESMDIFRRSQTKTCSENARLPTKRPSPPGNGCASWSSMKSTTAGSCICIWPCWA